MDDLAAVILCCHIKSYSSASRLYAFMLLCILSGVTILHMIFVHGASTLFLEDLLWCPCHFCLLTWKTLGWTWIGWHVGSNYRSL